MDEDKRKKKNKKKKNKSNKASEELAIKAEGASLEEVQGLQGTNTSSIINNETILDTELESKQNRQNAHGPADFSSGEQTAEPETRDSEKTDYNVEPFTAETDEKWQKYFEIKNALQRELAYSQTLRSQLALLEEQMTNCTVSEASKEEEIKRLKDKFKLQMQKEASIEDEIKRFKEEKISWLQKEGTMEKEIKRLKDEKSSWLQREAKTQEEIKSLTDEKQLWLQKEVFREEEIERLKAENNSLLKKEVTKEDEAKGLRFENFSLQKEVEDMKKSLESLSLEHQQLTAQAVAVQTGIQQLERNATVHSQLEQDIAIATTPEVSKQWLGWGSAKDPVAEVARIAEDSRLQKEAAAAIVEKLVIENTELMEKVNELSTIVDQLNKKCSSLAESKVRLQETAQDATALSPLTFKENSLSTKLSNGVGVTNYPSVSIVNNDVTSYTESEIVEIMASQDPVNNDVTSYMESEIVEIMPSQDPVTMEDGENGLSASDSIGTVEEAKQITSNSVREPVDMTFQKTSETVPFSDAPVMGAPIRLVSFLTKYVTGADLVKPKNLVAN